MYSIFTLHVYTTRLLLRGKTQTLLLGACSLSVCALLRSIEIWVESRDSGVMPSFLVITSSLIPFSCFNSTVHVSTKWKSMSTFFGLLVFKKPFFFFLALTLCLRASDWLCWAPHDPILKNIVLTVRRATFPLLGCTRHITCLNLNLNAAKAAILAQSFHSVWFL